MSRRPAVAYSREISDAILERIANGEVLQAICQDEGMPTAREVRAWARENVDDMTKRLSLAEENQLSAWADQCIQFADTPIIIERPYVKKDRTEGVETRDNVERSKEQIRIRQWMLSKRRRHVFGDTLADLPQTGTSLLDLIQQSMKPRPTPIEAPPRPRLAAADG